MTTPRKHPKGVHIDFSAEMHDALRTAAYLARLPIAEVVRQACAAYLKSNPVPHIEAPSK